MKAKNVINFIFIAAVLLVMVISGAGCSKQKSSEETESICYKPYIKNGVDCCLDRDDNNICDEDESVFDNIKKEDVSEEKSSVKIPSDKDVLGQIQSRYGKTFDIYPSDQYEYTTSDIIFEGYDRSVRIEGKQCHFYSERKHKALRENQPYWRPLPIACGTTEDCIDFIKRNDGYLNNLLIDEKDVLCVPYLFGLE